MSRAVPIRRILPIVVVGLIVVGGIVAWAQRDDGPKTLSDYCEPPKQIEHLPELEQAAAPTQVGFEHLVTVDAALAVAEVPDGRVLIAAKDGRLWQAPAGGGVPTLLLDLSGEVATATEQGLLGVAVAPAGDLVYIDATLTDGTARILEYALTPDGIDASSRRDVLVLDDPHPSHNGGRMTFDGEGMLLFGVGDGGNGDRTGAAQDLGSMFGKLLRIDPRADGTEAYSVPDDNPFVGTEGARGEIWALGFRNPWGWSIDRATGDLWVGDVGQVCFEEVSVATDAGKGQNFGWSHLEGAHEFEGPVLGLDGEPDDSVDPADVGPLPADLVAPVIEYGHETGRCSVLGGVVYRGAAIPELDGAYLWGDLCERGIHTLRRDGDVWVEGELGGEIPGGIVAIDQGADGEVYLVSLNDGLYRVTAP